MNQPPGPFPGWAQASNSAEEPVPSVTPPPLVPAPSEAHQPSDVPREDPHPSEAAPSETQRQGEVIHRDWYATFATGPIIGGIVGYELSHSEAVDAARSGSIASEARMVPTLTVTARGGFIGGLIGSF
jgi:hypothetical protein